VKRDSVSNVNSIVVVSFFHNILMSLSLISKYFSPKTILDIGANTGQFYSLCKSHFPESYCYLVEGNPRCEDSIKATGCDYSISLLSDSEKIVDFFVRSTEPLCTGNSIYRENTSFFSDDQIIIEKIRTKTLDSLIPDKTFDLVKIDVQGSEIDIMRGGHNIISKSKGVLLEVSLVEYNLNSPSKKQVYDYMYSIGFVDAELIGNINHPIHGYLIQQDILFINKQQSTIYSNPIPNFS
jgi:FkbM family methyltransferase